MWVTYEFHEEKSLGSSPCLLHDVKSQKEEHGGPPLRLRHNLGGCFIVLGHGGGVGGASSGLESGVLILILFLFLVLISTIDLAEDFLAGAHA